MSALTRTHRKARRAAVPTVPKRIAALEARLAELERRVAQLEAERPNRLGPSIPDGYKPFKPSWPTPQAPWTPDTHPDVVPVTPTWPGTWPGQPPIITCKTQTNGTPVSEGGAAS